MRRRPRVLRNVPHHRTGRPNAVGGETERGIANRCGKTQIRTQPFFHSEILIHIFFANRVKCSLIFLPRALPPLLLLFIPPPPDQRTVAAPLTDCETLLFLSTKPTMIIFTELPLVLSADSMPKLETPPSPSSPALAPTPPTPRPASPSSPPSWPPGSPSSSPRGLSYGKTNILTLFFGSRDPPPRV